MKVRPFLLTQQYQQTLKELADYAEQHPYSIAYSNTGEQFIQCLTCHLKSYNPNDIKEKYCGYCHKFHAQ